MDMSNEIVHHLFIVIVGLIIYFQLVHPTIESVKSSFRRAAGAKPKKCCGGK